MQLKIILEGEVQGVFFRAFIKEMAKKLNLKGYVKNIENNVEIHAKGEKENKTQERLTMSKTYSSFS